MADTQVNQTGGGDGMGGLYALLAIVIALIIVALILFIPRGADDGTRDIEADIRIETPELPERSPPPDDGGDAGGGNGDGPGS
jgi:hypothetical protein